MSESLLPFREAIAKIVGSLPTDEYEATDRIIALFEAQFLDEYGDADIPDDLPLREKIERLAFVVMASPFQMSSRAVASRVLALCGAEQSEGPAPTEDFKPAFMRWAQSLPEEPVPISVAFKAGWEARGRTVQALHPSHVPALMHVVSMLDHGNTKVAREEAMWLLNEVRGRE